MARMHVTDGQKLLRAYVPELMLFEPRREKTGFLHMRKERRRSASR